MEQTRYLHKFCFPILAVERKMREDNFGIGVQQFLGMRTDCGDYAPSHSHNNKECPNNLLKYLP
jgi:hypothetical protein